MSWLTREAVRQLGTSSEEDWLGRSQRTLSRATVLFVREASPFRGRSRHFILVCLLALLVVYHLVRLFMCLFESPSVSPHALNLIRVMKDTSQWYLQDPGNKKSDWTVVHNKSHLRMSVPSGRGCVIVSVNCERLHRGLSRADHKAIKVEHKSLVAILIEKKVEGYQKYLAGL